MTAKIFVPRFQTVSLSAMWSQGRYSHMAEFAGEAHGFGFTHIELNYACSSQKITELLQAEGVKISSVHAPCPLDGLRVDNGKVTPRYLSSLDEDVRREGIGMIKKSIELAVELGAAAVVVHSGRVNMGFDLTDKLNQLYEQGLFGTPQYVELQAEIVAKRALMAEPHLEATRKSLTELAGYATEAGVKLGLENRMAYYETPTFAEMRQLLSELSPDAVGYWHDMGHAEIQSRLGFTLHQDWFDAFSDRMVGAHLHDVKGLKDHHAPGIGEMDWAFMARNLPADIIKTCEIGQWNDPSDAASAVGFLKGKGIV